jgi:hypothetical protein
LLEASDAVIEAEELATEEGSSKRFRWTKVAVGGRLIHLNQ